MTNFAFIKPDFPALYADIVEAESLVFSNPTPSAIMARSVLENGVNWLYENDRKLTRPFRSDLSTLMHEEAFRGLFNATVFKELNLVRKTGNAAAHGTRVSEADALALVKYLFRFLRFLAIYYGKTEPKTQVFDDALIPRAPRAPRSASSSASSKTSAVKGVDAKTLKKLLDEIESKNKKAREKEQEILAQAKENAEEKRRLEQQAIELSKLKAEREQSFDFDQVVPLLVSEAETRQRYIDISLAESGWVNLKKDRDLEYKVTGMPVSTNASGTGYVDYVLWGDNNLPLAVVEAKRTLTNPKKGKHQSVLYADCLEAMHGQRPIIFYTNGFDTYLWDDQFYPEREVSGFYTKDELQRLVNRRDAITGRKDLREFSVNKDIAGRAYQMQAIARVAENSVGDVVDGGTKILRGRLRQSLLVMATGSGKTRTSAALVDMFTKCNWAKRILFLADRNALVTQAKNAFNEHLPHLSAIDLTKEKEDKHTRLVFSTYPTIMNRIDGVRNANNGAGADERFYGVGHFDLIIIDEAHRSVYQKYKAIFEYFDAMLIGLTATPKKDVGHDTYGLFGIEDDNPTFAYELDEAVKEGFLVPPKAFSVPLKFVRDGIKYNELSEKEKQQYEEKFGDPTSEEVPDEIDSNSVNRWLFNTTTVDKVLDYLMTKGIKVQGGEKLGKTIMFAKSHKHAEFIEERFNKNYPQYTGKFLRVIDNYESKAQDMLETFVDQHNEVDPQIAVSVDMMDTGVDAPRVVNLVFFKPVKSSSKFWQMIGRGTRLCPDLFAPGDDKKEFLIFDICKNFEFFEAQPDGYSGKAVKKISQRIFEAKLEVALLIRSQQTSTDEQRELAVSYINELHAQINGLDHERFEVKAQLQHVVEYSNIERWQSVANSDMLDINTHLSMLPIAPKSDDEYAKRFDILVLNYQLGLLTAAYSTDSYQIKIRNISTSLLKKVNVPEVASKEALLRESQTQDFFKEINVNRLDDLRIALRGLMKYLDKDQKKDVITNFEDDLDVAGVQEMDVMPSYSALQSYRDRVESYVRNNGDHLVIHKLKTNKQITQTELEELERILFDGDAIGTKEQYTDSYGDKPLGEFIRSIVGLEITAAQEAFAEFLQAGNLSADQMTFINTIVTYLSKNGVIDKSLLFEPPFTHIHDQGLVGVFSDKQAGDVIRMVDAVNGNARALGA